MTLTEYIRKRRLSKAAEELKRTEHKIIDIATKYHYDSPVSFSNAFKKMYGQSPANFRKSDDEVTFFSRIEFNPNIKGKKEMKYRIVEKEEQIFYGKSTGLIADTDKKSISDLYAQAKKDGTMDFILKHSKGKEKYYGVYYSIYENGQYQNKGEYYLLGKTPREDFVEIKLPKAKWACFTVPNHEQSDIIKLDKKIYENWLPDSEYYWVSKYPEFEVYYENHCEICIAVQ